MKIDSALPSQDVVLQWPTFSDAAEEMVRTEITVLAANTVGRHLTWIFRSGLQDC
jgi:hypothetical protein